MLSEALGLRGVETSAYRVLLRDLELICSIGIYEHERRRPQRVRVNAALMVEGAPDPAADDFSQVYNYEAVVEAARAIAAGGHLNLVETFAARLADACLRDPRVASARVTVEKLEAFPDARSVGVTIERRRRPGGIGTP